MARISSTKSPSPEDANAQAKRGRRKSSVSKPHANGVTKNRPKRTRRAKTPDMNDVSKPGWARGLNKDNRVQPSYHGWIKGSLDALILVEKSLSGDINHIARRPHDDERPEIIVSGSVFVYEAESSGITRWTDTRDWSPSRITGNFLMYRELEEPGPNGDKKKALPDSKAKQFSTRSRAELIKSFESLGVKYDEHQMNDEVATKWERDICGSLIESYGFKTGGLLKKTISVKYQGIVHHVVSYYNADDVLNGRLRRPIDEFAGCIPRSELISQQTYRTSLEDEDVVKLRTSGGLLFIHTPAYQDWAMASQPKAHNSHSGAPSWPGTNILGSGLPPGDLAGYPPNFFSMMGQPGVAMPGHIQAPVQAPIQGFPPVQGHGIHNPGVMFHPHMIARHQSEQSLPACGIQAGHFQGQDRQHSASFNHGQRLGSQGQQFGVPAQNFGQNFEGQGMPQPDVHPADQNGLNPAPMFPTPYGMDPDLIGDEEAPPEAPELNDNEFLHHFLANQYSQPESQPPSSEQIQMQHIQQQLRDAQLAGLPGPTPPHLEQFMIQNTNQLGINPQVEEQCPPGSSSQAPSQPGTNLHVQNQFADMAGDMSGVADHAANISDQVAEGSSEHD